MAVLILGSILNRNVIGSRRTFHLISLFTQQNTEFTGVLNRLWYKDIPQNAPQIISKNLTTKRLFTNAHWNNYIIWHLPEIKTFSDAQSYNRQDKDWQDEKTIASGGQEWESLLIDYDIDTIIRDRAPANPSVYTPVQNLPNWKLIYINEIYSIYARSDVIKSLPVDISKIEPDLQTIEKYKEEDKKEAVGQLLALLNFDSKNGFAREQLIIYYINTEHDLQKAKKLTEESRHLIPYDPRYSLQLAFIYTEEGKCALALDFKKEAVSKSFNDPLYKYLTHRATEKCSI